MAQKKTKDYFRDKMRESRQLDKDLGRRYRAWEHMPGESYTDFKRRLKSQKLLCIVCITALVFFQMKIF